MRSGGSKHEISPFAKDEFFFESGTGTSTLKFMRDSKGIITSVILKHTSSNMQWDKTDKTIAKIEAIELEDSLFDKYAGSYELAPNFNLKLFKQDGIMYTQATGQPKVEIIAFETHKFVLKDTDIKLTINLDESGEVVSLTLHQNGEHEAKKKE